MSLGQVRRGVRAASRRRSSSDPYGDAVRADSPVAWWRGNGSTTDETGGTAGTLVGATYGTGILPARPSAQVFNLDGIDDYVSIPDQAKLDRTTAFSLELWFLADTLPASGAWASLLSKQPNYLAEIFGAQVEFQIASTQAAYSPITAGTLYHYAATWDGSNLRLYLNGVLQSTVAFTGPPVGNTSPVRVGSYDGAVEFFDGRIAEVALYGSALSGTRIGAHYTAGTTAP